MTSAAIILTSHLVGFGLVVGAVILWWRQR